MMEILGILAFLLAATVFSLAILYIGIKSTKETDRIIKEGK